MSMSSEINFNFGFVDLKTLYNLLNGNQQVAGLWGEAYGSWKLFKNLPENILVGENRKE